MTAKIISTFRPSSYSVFIKGKGGSTIGQQGPSTYLHSHLPTRYPATNSVPSHLLGTQFPTRYPVTYVATYPPRYLFALKPINPTCLPSIPSSASSVFIWSKGSLFFSWLVAPNYQIPTSVIWNPYVLTCLQAILIFTIHLNIHQNRRAESVIQSDTMLCNILHFFFQKATYFKLLSSSVFIEGRGGCTGWAGVPAWDQQPSLGGDPGGPRGARRGGDPLRDHHQPDPTLFWSGARTPVLPSHIYRLVINYMALLRPSN